MAFANQPSGTLLTEWGLSSHTLPDRWGWDWAPPIYSDGGAGSYSPPYYARQAYPIGFTDGVSPNNFYYILENQGDVHSLYCSYFWRASNPWQGHDSQTNKVHFFAPQPQDFFLVVEMWGPVSGPWDYAIYYPQNSPVNNSHLPNIVGSQPGTAHLLPNINDTKVVLGQWHEIELYAKYSSSVTGDQVGWIVIYEDDTTDIPLFCIDLSSPVTPNGGDLTWTPTSNIVAYLQQ